MPWELPSLAQLQLQAVGCGTPKTEFGNLPADVLQVMILRRSASVIDVCKWIRAIGNVAKETFNDVELLLSVAIEAASQMRRMSDKFDLATICGAIQKARKHCQRHERAEVAPQGQSLDPAAIAKELRVSISDLCRRAVPYMRVLQRLDEMNSTSWADYPAVDTLYAINDPSFATYVFRHCNVAFQYAREPQTQDKLLVLELVQRRGALLQFAASSLKNDMETVLAAVRQDGMALRFASERLMSNRDVVLTAVSRCALAYYDAGESVKTDPDVMIAAAASDLLYGELLATREHGLARDVLCAFLLLRIADELEGRVSTRWVLEFRCHLTQAACRLVAGTYWNGEPSGGGIWDVHTLQNEINSLFPVGWKGDAMSGAVNEWCYVVPFDFNEDTFADNPEGTPLIEESAVLPKYEAFIRHNIIPIAFAGRVFPRGDSKKGYEQPAAKLLSIIVHETTARSQSLKEVLDLLF